MACSKEALRIMLWMCWVIQWLFNCIFVAITLISFTQLWTASTIYLTGGTNVYTNASWRAPMAACILSSLLVLGYDIMSCVTLIKKSINRAGPGYGYGFIVAFCFCLGFFLLLVGLVLDSFRPLVKNLSNYDWTFNGTAPSGAFKWTSSNSQTFIGAEVFALINFVVLLIFAVILVVLQQGVNEQLGIEKTQYTPLEATPMVPAAYAQGGYAEGMEQGQPDQYQYGYQETNLTEGSGVPLANTYQTQGTMNAASAAGYSAAASDYAPASGYAPATAAPAAVTPAYYAQGSARYEAAYYDGSTQQHPGSAGSGLLGGQGLGAAPQGAPPAYQPPAPPAYANYQQF